MLLQMISEDSSAGEDGGCKVIFSASRTSFSTMPPVFRRRLAVSSAYLQCSLLVPIGIAIMSQSLIWESPANSSTHSLVW